MGFYQYYEFRAIARPLSREQIEEVREFSSRADITPTRFVNEYHWGDFRGRPEHLLTHYFDAHLYGSSQGRVFALRMPAGVVDEEVIGAYVDDDFLTCSDVETGLIVEFSLMPEDGFEFYVDTDWLDELVGVYDLLMRGDLRAFYLCFLGSVSLYGPAYEGEDFDADEEFEPPVPAGLGELPEPLKALAEFLGVDRDLLDVAAEGSPPMGAEQDPMGKIEAWLQGRPKEELAGALAAVLRGEDVDVRGRLFEEYRQTDFFKDTRPGAGGARRSVRELVEAAEVRGEERARREAEERARKKVEEAEAARVRRERHIASLVGKEAGQWKEIESTMNSRSSRRYQNAVSILSTLREVYLVQGKEAEFAGKMEEFVGKYGQSPALMRRLEDAGFARFL